ncbi:CcdB family protein [Paraburkholderia sp. LEh10]|uniref:CcdB family protein n=1 Tax=Paraburkholderia sp. LEh10 TaxID=2821353 RepID=UPI001AE77AE2|nr:CcdB family protein [Paraburkholderia sp. LEh10]MBP0593537.1 CcdB family protein [Paraburkholderia sp. LEh10]
MARFEVYANPGKSKANTPYLVDVQSDFLEGLAFRVVVPLIRADSFPPGKLPADFTPSFEIGGIKCLMHPAFIASVPLSELGRTIGSLREHQDKITAALDRLLGGY